MERQISSQSTLYIHSLGAPDCHLEPEVILHTPMDIFPNIDIPVISVAWTYAGLNREDLETRLHSVREGAHDAGR